MKTYVYGFYNTEPLFFLGQPACFLFVFSNIKQTVQSSEGNCFNITNKSTSWAKSTLHWFRLGTWSVVTRVAKSVLTVQIVMCIIFCNLSLSAVLFVDFESKIISVETGSHEILVGGTLSDSGKPPWYWVSLPTRPSHMTGLWPAISLFAISSCWQVQWSPSCVSTPSARPKWSHKRGGLSSEDI